MIYVEHLGKKKKQPCSCIAVELGSLNIIIMARKNVKNILFGWLGYVSVQAWKKLDF